jgi:hypothetical protein
MTRQRPERSLRKLVLPVVLVMSVTVGVAALTGASLGCDDDDDGPRADAGPRTDAGVGDAGVDTPII